MTDEYTTIRLLVREEAKVKGSRFIAAACPVRGTADVDALLDGEKKRYHGATHYCYAFRLGLTGEDRHYSDAGEPSGSAGKPILSAIERRGLTEVAVVVTRFFGGTKLGVGGLARAYGDIADRALRAAETVTCHVTAALQVAFPHSLVSNVMHVVSRSGARIVDTQYDEEVHLTLEIRQGRLQELKTLLMEHTSGNIRWT